MSKSAVSVSFLVSVSKLCAFGVGALRLGFLVGVTEYQGTNSPNFLFLVSAFAFAFAFVSCF